SEDAPLARRIQADIAAELGFETRAAVASGKFPARTLCRGYDDRRATTDDRRPAGGALQDAQDRQDQADGRRGHLSAPENSILSSSSCASCKEAVGPPSTVGGRSSVVVREAMLLRPLSIDTLWDV